MKRFLIGCTLFLLPILVLIGYYQIFLHPKFQSLADMECYNLSSLGFVLFDENYTTSIVERFPEEQNWLVRDFDKNNSSCDTNLILTLGDSYSQKRKGSYSNQLAHIYDKCTIANRNNPYPFPNPFVKYWELFVNDTVLPNIVIVESVERFLVNRLLELDFNRDNLNDIVAFEDGNGKKMSDLQRRVKRNSDYYRNLLMKEKNRPVKHAKLNKEMFTCKEKESDFYFYDQEISITNTIDEIEIAVEKLDSLYMFADERGINLIILVAADMYDVYQSYIDNNPYPPKTVLDELSSRINHPNFINSKELFLPLLDQGMKDVYWCSDTHWSPVGAKIVAEEIARRMDSLGVFQK